MENRVLFITPFFSPNVGGVETHLDDLINYLNEKEVSVDVITYTPLTTKVKAPLFERRKENKIYRLPWPGFGFFFKLEKHLILQFLYLTSGLLAISFIVLMLNRKKYDVISCHGLSAGLIGWLLKIFFKKRTVLTLHTIYKFSKKPQLKRMAFFIKKMDAVLVLAESAKKDLIKSKILSSNKVFVYKNWVDESIFKPIPQKKSRRKIGLKENEFYALFIGRLTNEKGIKELLKAVPFLDKNIKLIIIGYGPLKKNVLGSAKKFDNIIFVGTKDIKEIPFYLNASDILLFGAVDEDYLGIVSISALACGLPIILPNKTAYHNKVKNVDFRFPSNKIGMIIDTDPKKFAKKINKIFKQGINNVFSRRECVKFFKANYNRDINGKIIYNSYFKN